MWSAVIDDGNEDLLDVYEFTPYDSDAEIGVLHEFPSADAGLEFAMNQLGAVDDKFVNEEDVQYE
jgi:hypothetical protein